MAALLSRFAAVGLATVLALGAASAARADVLWDQSSVDAFGAGFFDSESGGPPFGITVHSVSDVTVGGGGWTVESITTYYSALDGLWGTGITQAYLHVYPKSSSVPPASDDPTADPLVTVSAVMTDGMWVLTATGLGLALPAGDWWIGLTPIAPGGFFGPEIHLSSTTGLVGDATASYDPYAFPGPPEWTDTNPGVDAAILIEGMPMGPTAVEATGWGALKARFGK